MRRPDPLILGMVLPFALIAIATVAGIILAQR